MSRLTRNDWLMSGYTDSFIGHLTFQGNSFIGVSDTISEVISSFISEVISSLISEVIFNGH